MGVDLPRGRRRAGPQRQNLTVIITLYGLLLKTDPEKRNPGGLFNQHILGGMVLDRGRFRMQMEHQSKPDVVNKPSSPENLHASGKIV